MRVYGVSQSSGVERRSFWSIALNFYKGNTLVWRRRAEDEIRASGLAYTSPHAAHTAASARAQPGRARSTTYSIRKATPQVNRPRLGAALAGAPYARLGPPGIRKAGGPRRRCSGVYRRQRRFVQRSRNDGCLQWAVMTYWPIVLISAAAGMVVLVAMLVLLGRD